MLIAIYTHLLGAVVQRHGKSVNIPEPEDSDVFRMIAIVSHLNLLLLDGIAGMQRQCLIEDCPSLRRTTVEIILKGDLPKRRAKHLAWLSNAMWLR